MVLRERIELSTSPLPRECSTTELPQPSVFQTATPVVTPRQAGSVKTLWFQPHWSAEVPLMKGVLHHPATAATTDRQSPRQDPISGHCQGRDRKSGPACPGTGVEQAPDASRRIGRRLMPQRPGRCNRKRPRRPCREGSATRGPECSGRRSTRHRSGRRSTGGRAGAPRRVAFAGGGAARAPSASDAAASTFRGGANRHYAAEAGR